MPTYDYRCSGQCQDFEKYQSIHDEALKTCPRCQQDVVRLISKNVGIQFSGSGFYRNDSRMSTKKKSVHEKKVSSQSSDSESKKK